MLDDTLKAQLQAYLGKLQRPIRLIASLDDSASSQEMRELLTTIAGLSDQVAFDDSGSDARKPSFVIARESETTGVRFAAIPLGHEFTRWCSPCCGPAATRPRPNPRRWTPSAPCRARWTSRST
jgi:alkyl hydroperoxide reductase subunit F